MMDAALGIEKNGRRKSRRKRRFSDSFRSVDDGPFGVSEYILFLGPIFVSWMFSLYVLRLGNLPPATMNRTHVKS